MAFVNDNRVKLQSGNKPNAATAFSGTNGSAAAGGFINFNSMHDPITGVLIATNDTVPYTAYVDSLFETGVGTLDKTAHTLTRTKIISNSSGTKVAIDFSGASANPTLISHHDALRGQTAHNLLRPGIYGLELSAPSNTTLAASAGCAFIEGDYGAPLSAAALGTISPSLAASTHYNAFMYLSSGVPTLESVSGGSAGSTNPPVAFAIPAGNARSKTADTSRRFLGSYLTNASSQIRPFRMIDKGGGIAETTYLADSTGAAPFAPLVSGNATTYTAVNLSNIIPNNGTAVEALIFTQVVSIAGTSIFLSLSTDGVGYSGLVNNPMSTAGTTAYWTGWVQINSTTTTGLYYKINSGSGACTINCYGYRFRR